MSFYIGIINFDIADNIDNIIKDDNIAEAVSSFVSADIVLTPEN